MPDYQNGKIYKITAGDLTYIGSTCEPTLARRLALHVSNYKRWLKGAGNCSCFSLIETGQYEITLIELCPCESKDELTARERLHIGLNVCVNKRMKLTEEQLKEVQKESVKKYAEEHADKMREYAKKHYIENADKMREYAKKHYTENVEKKIEYAKKYNVEHAEKIKEYKKKYYQDHKKV